MQGRSCAAPESYFSADEIIATPAAKDVRLLRPHVFASSQLLVSQVSN